MGETKKCDVLVVGAGPVGSVFSYVAAKNGLDVLMVDRKNEVAAPLRGGEAVSKLLFEELTEVIPHLSHFYKWPINETLIYTPVSKITSKEDKWKSYMMNRKEAEKVMVQAAIKAGTELRLGVTVDGVTKNGENITEVHAQTVSGELRIAPKIVVGADGATSIIRRSLIGEKNYAGINDWGCAIELEVTNLDIREGLENSMQLFMGEVTGGYGYIFPKGNDRADVGVGARPFYGENPLDAESPLETFYTLSRNNPEMGKQIQRCSPLEIKGGIIDLSSPIYPVYGNTILVGDSANQNFSYVGEGLIPGWEAAIIAGGVVTEALETRSNDVLKKYPVEYEAGFIGTEARKTVAIKDNISKVTLMPIENKRKSVLTSMLELEVIEWTGKELPAALTYHSTDELLDYAEKLISEKGMKISITRR